MPRIAKSAGFSLMEVLVALALLALAMGILSKIFIAQASSYKMQARMVQRQQGLRAALEIIARDGRSAGYPVLDESFLADLASWLPSTFIPKTPMVVVPKGIFTVTGGGNQPDLLSLLTAIPSETNPARLSAPVLNGDTVLYLDLNSSQINDQYNVGDIVYLGKPAVTAIITGIAGRALTIDTNPYQPGNQGLKESYPAGTEVGEISLVSYAVFTDDNDPGARYHDRGVPVLKRKINAGSFEPLCEEITDLKMTPLKPELFSLRLSTSTGLGNALQLGQGGILTMITQIMKRN